MKKTGSFLTLSIVAGVLLTVGFACGKSETPPTTNANNTSTTASNGAAANSTSTPASTPKPAPRDIAGSYSASGRNADGGGSYEADLTVRNRGDVYQFSWDSNGRIYDGVGVQNDDKVAVSYTSGASGKGCGVVLYKINSDGSLDGTAGYWGTNTKETERAARTSGADLDGEYDVKGKNTDGKEYTAKLSVKKEGEGYGFNWSGNVPLKGFGIKQGDTVSVGFGGANCAFVAYEVKPDGTLEGKWGSAASTDFGTETAKKK